MSHSGTSDVLLVMLRVIERSILPRAIGLRTQNGRLHIDVATQRVLLCPRFDQGFVLDDTLELEAPRAWEILRAGADAAMAAAETLNADRDALLRHCARILFGLSTGATFVERSVLPRPLLQPRAGSPLPSFHALELARAFTQLLQEQAGGSMPAFYRHLARTTADAWLFALSGQSAGFPAQVTELAQIGDMANAVPAARAWREHLNMPEGPLMSIFVGPSRDTLRCLAMDGDHIALVSLPGMELGAVLAGWRAVQQSVGEP